MSPSRTVPVTAEIAAIAGPEPEPDYAAEYARLKALADEKTAEVDRLRPGFEALEERYWKAKREYLAATAQAEGAVRAAENLTRPQVLNWQTVRAVLTKAGYTFHPMRDGYAHVEGFRVAQTSYDKRRVEVTYAAPPKLRNALAISRQDPDYAHKLKAAYAALDNARDGAFEAWTPLLERQGWTVKRAGHRNALIVARPPLLVRESEGSSSSSPADPEPAVV